VLAASIAGLVALATVAAAEPAAAPAPPTAQVPAAPPRSWDYAVLPLVYYQPETSFGAAGQVVLVRTASSGGAEGRHDTLSASVTASWRRQFAVALSGSKFWNADRDRVGVDVLAERFPNSFWGLGSDTPASALDHYTPILGGTQINYAHRVLERIFAGVITTAGYYRVQSFEPGGAVADFLATRRREGWLVGVGPTLGRDSRDDSNFPRAGSLTTLRFTAYRPAWLSQYRFVDLSLDQRTFVGLPLRSVLALQAFGEVIVGEPPIELLPALGGPGLLRGYFQGRYRDKVYLAAQAEWRVPLFWRFGAALFGAAGDVFPDLGHVAADRTKVAGGLGLRLDVGRSNPINIRLDGAVAPGSTGIYLVIGEAI